MKNSTWFGLSDPVAIIDTPGWLDSKERTAEQLDNFSLTLRNEAKYINCFLLVLKATDRIYPQILKMLSSLDFAYPSFFRNLAIVFTYWDESTP